MTEVSPGQAAARRIGANSAIIFTTEAVSMGVAGAVGLLLIRYLGRDEYGLLTSLFAHVYVFQFLSSLGIDTIVLRDAARAPERAGEIVSRALGLRLLLIVCSMVVSVLAAFALAPTPQYPLYAAIMTTTYLSYFYPYFLVRYTVELRQAAPRLTLGAVSLALAAVKLLMILAAAPLVAFVVLEPATCLATLAAAWWLGRKSGLRLNVAWAPAHWWWLLREAWPVAATNAFTFITMRLDNLLLLRFSGASQVGLYGACVRLVDLIVTLPAALQWSAFPLMARLAVESEERLEKATRLSFRAMAWVSLPIGAWLYIYAESVLTVLFGSSFTAAAPILRMLALALPGVFIWSVLINRLNATAHQRTAAALAGAVAALSVILNLLWIPHWQGEGAALAAAVSYAASPLLALAFPASRHLARHALWSLLKPLPACLACAALLQVMGWGPLAGAGLLVVAYTACMLALREWTAEEARLLRYALGRD